VSLDIPVETAGKRGYRIARAERLSLAARLDLAEAGWRVRSRLRAALAEYGAAARAVDLLRAEEAARSDATALVERRLAAGAASRPDLDRARLDLARTRLDLRVAEGRAAEARSALAGALGVPLAALDGASFRWPEPEALPPAEALPLGEVRRAGLLNRIDVRRGLEEYAAAEAALALELAKRYPDVRFAPGYEFDGGANKFRIGLSIELPVLNRNEGPIAEAEARRAEKAAAFTALEARAVEEIETALARYRGARAELSEAEALLDAERAREDAVARAVAAGAADRLELALARVEGAVLARARLDALLKAHLALGALEDAVEQPLAPRVPLPEAFPAPERRETSAQERGAPEPSVGSVCSVPTTSDEADP
jgi:outer membrane protein TolC